jgi:hypothetical protein
MLRSQSDKAYSEWLDRRKAEDERDAEIAKHEQENRWREFRRDDEEDDGTLDQASDLTQK